MSCKACNSESTRTFRSEVLIHFPGLDGLKKPIVFLFPVLIVCFQCGSAEFKVPEKELRVLSTGKPVQGTGVLDDYQSGS